MQKITPFLWFDSQAEEAARHYVSIFKNSKLGDVARYGEVGAKADKVMHAILQIKNIDGKGNASYAVRVNCLDGVDAQEFAAAPVRYFDMLHDDFKSPPAETRHL